MSPRTVLVALGICALGLPLSGCSSLSRPEEILIAAEPAAAPPKPAAAAPAPAPERAPVQAPTQPASAG